MDYCGSYLTEGNSVCVCVCNNYSFELVFWQKKKTLFWVDINYLDKFHMQNQKEYLFDWNQEL